MEFEINELGSGACQLFWQCAAQNYATQTFFAESPVAWVGMRCVVGSTCQEPNAMYFITFKTFFFKYLLRIVRFATNSFGAGAELTYITIYFLQHKCVYFLQVSGHPALFVCIGNEFTLAVSCANRPPAHLGLASRCSRWLAVVQTPKWLQEELGF